MQSSKSTGEPLGDNLPPHDIHTRAPVPKTLPGGPVCIGCVQGRPVEAASGLGRLHSGVSRDQTSCHTGAQSVSHARLSSVARLPISSLYHGCRGWTERERERGRTHTFFPYDEGGSVGTEGGVVIKKDVSECSVHVLRRLGGGRRGPRPHAASSGLGERVGQSATSLARPRRPCSGAKRLKRGSAT